MKTDTLVLSDLHLASPVCQSKEILKILDKVKFKRLILLGDVFDNDRFRRLKHNHFKVLYKINEFTSDKNDIEVIWVLGNHDRGMLQIASCMMGVEVFEEYKVTIGDRHYIFVHGDVFDDYIQKRPILTYFAGEIYYFLQKFGGKSKGLARFLKKNSREWLQLSNVVCQRAVEYAKTIDVSLPKTIICGHTHICLETEIDDISYINTGSWTDQDCSFVTIDEEGARLHRLDS